MEADQIVSMKAVEQTGQRPLKAFCWVAILVASSLPLIIVRQFSHGLNLVVVCVQLAFLLLAFASTFVLSQVRSLRSFLLALLMLVLGWNLLIPSLLDSTAWSNFLEIASPGLALIVLNLIRLLALPLILVSLIGSRVTRGDLFLQKGRIRTVTRLRILGRPLTFSWPVLGIIFLLVAGVVLPLDLTLTLRVGGGMLGRTLLNFPFILVGALMNSFNEEFEFRSVLMAHLRGVVGDRQALWLSTVLFGLAHYFGLPSGIIGVLLAMIAGLVWAGSMLETRGIVWAWLTHFVQDAVIFSFFLTYL